MKKFLLSPWSNKKNQSAKLIATAILVRFFLCCVPEVGAVDFGANVNPEELPPLRAKATKEGQTLRISFDSFTRSNLGTENIYPYLEIVDRYLSENVLESGVVLAFDLTELGLSSLSCAALVRYITGNTKLSERSYHEILKEKLVEVNLSGNNIQNDAMIDSYSTSTWLSMLETQNKVKIILGQQKGTSQISN